MARYGYLRRLEVAQPEPPRPPPLPPGRLVAVPGRGEMFVREQPAIWPVGRPTILLLHGWTLCSDINWFAMYGGLARHGHVLAMDVRGHGRGIRSEERFTLEAAADDAAALLDHLGIGTAVVVGYSMGGSIALLLLRRHPDKVAGLVLQSTALQWRAAWHERLAWSSMGGLEYLLRLGVHRGVIERYLRRAREQNPDVLAVLPWLKAEALRGDPADLADAGRALGAFDARPWAARIDVPTAVVVSRRDRLVLPARQRTLAEALPGATTVEVDAGHNGWLVAPGVVCDALETALGLVVAPPGLHQSAFGPLS